MYHEGKDEDAPADDARPADVEADDEEERRLPLLKEGQVLDLRSLLPRQHFTSPPPRFSEATLVKELEENGIGRPSTYAAIIATIMDRNYAEKDKGRFFPTELGLLVNDLIVASFGDIVDVGYTARMEEELDAIEEGRLNWVDALREFQTKFEVDLARAKTEMRDVKREAIPTDQVCEKCGKPMVLKWGRFGQFLACSGYPECKNTREIGSVSPGDAPDDGGAGAPAAAKRATVKAAAPDPIETEAEPCQKCGRPMVLKRGRFGAFLACSGYPECKTTRKIVVSKEGKGGSEGRGAARRAVPQVRQQARGQAGPLRRVHRVLELPEVQVHQDEGNRRALPRVRQGADRRAEEQAREGLLRLRPLPRLQLRPVEQARRQGVPRLQEPLPRREDHQEGRPPPALRAGRVRLRRADRRRGGGDGASATSTAEGSRARSCSIPSTRPSPRAGARIGRGTSGRARRRDAAARP